MKYLKISIMALVAVLTFGSAEAQINVRIGGHPHRRRVAVVHHRWHRPYHRRNVVVVHHR
ncbi:MAG: hypothetical protein JWR67_1007 [Mucilaginibacter sp.]|nr:hypothetical protein [Mucilaginibacter sp.]MDB5109893.1 hypothetical protein [Mucilaginibacter sp.]